MNRPAAALAALVVLGSLAACSSSSPSPTSSSPSSHRLTSTAPASSTTATTAGPSPVGYPSPQLAAQHLLDAWRNRDTAAAGQGADPTAVVTMFQVPASELDARGCDTGEFSPSSCVYKLLANQYELRLDMDKRSVGWVVADVSYTPPS